MVGGGVVGGPRGGVFNFSSLPTDLSSPDTMQSYLAFDTSSKAQPAWPEGSGRGKRAALRAASFHPRAHLPDICGLRLASRSLAACRDVARAAPAQRRPAGCRHGALATQRVTLEKSRGREIVP